MKYGKEWKRNIIQLPAPLQKISLSYKFWKKQVKRNVLDTRNLKTECERLRREFTQLYNRKPFMPCMNKCMETFDKNDVLAFLQINKTTLYKLNKKITKHLHTSFDYGGYLGDWIVRTELDLQHKEPGDCPICFDAINSCVILKCGHLVCQECFEVIYKVKGKRGTVVNILSNCCPWIACPLCRHKMHYTQLSNCSFWPSQKYFSDILH